MYGLLIYIWGGGTVAPQCRAGLDPAAHDKEHSFSRCFGLLIGVIAIIGLPRGLRADRHIALWADSAVDRSGAWLTIPSDVVPALNRCSSSPSPSAAALGAAWSHGAHRYAAAQDALGNHV
jgi:hypothetical protein